MLREQVITPRGGRSSSSSSSSVSNGRATGGQQRPPAKRGGRSSSSGSGPASKGGSTAGPRVKWSSVVAYVPLVVKCLLAVILGVVIFAAYRAVASASFFQANTIDIEGTNRASKDNIRAVVRRSVAQTGVWNADIAKIGAELKAQPWVRSVVVSRVLPSGLRVRVTEREPRAVVRTSSGRFVWVDEESVTLGAVASTDKMPAFFMRGLDESGSDAARAGNRERITKYLELVREAEASGIGNRISEVNLEDLRDVRVQLAGNDSQVEVRLGKEDLSKRLQQALKVLDEQRKTPRGPFITYVDVTQGTRAAVGTNPKAQAIDEGVATSTENREPARIAKRTNRNREEKAQQGESRKENVAKRTKGDDKRKVENQASKRATAAGAERPRRVG